MAKVGWIGLGNMGNPMSQNLLKAGNEVTVWNRTKAKADAAVSAGAKWADTPKAVAEANDFIFTMVSDGPTLHAVNLGADGIVAGLSAGKVVIDMSTVSVEESAKVNEAIEAKGAKFLRAPVTGSTMLAQNATLGILASGDKATYEKTLPLFEKLGANQFYLGGAEEARVMKLSLNLMIGVTMQMEAEAVVLAEKAGLDVTQVCEIIAGSAVGSPLTGYKKVPISSGDYKPAFSVKLMEKDFDLAFAVAKQYGVPLATAAATRQNLQSADAIGWGDQDFSVLTKLVETQSGYTR
ncbi:MAG: NAD(P)-dependent oxidoreductase [Clostridiales Family XIII bacterium]|jgi:3-hydroxyisobutyrate dehydrogenase-like beta-hydroxyacid dehydrogenase|nr:NAD(P)-dependent oxidoreductase [Clostridiales Family XIII bacterium]